MMNGIELREVTKAYDGRPALSKISLTFARGAHTAIIGPSGCGKSTLLRLIAGLELPSAGDVLFGQDLVSVPGKLLRPPHKRGISMVFQDLALWPNLSALDNVLLGLSASALSRQEARNRAIEALSLCSIETLSGRRPRALSGGEQQRVALARALAVRPAFLLLDEPFSGLDLVTKLKLLDEIQALAAKREATLILVTHDPLEAKRLCGSAVLLDEGKVEEAGPLKELLESPQSEMLRVFRELS